MERDRWKDIRSPITPAGIDWWTSLLEEEKHALHAGPNVEISFPGVCKPHTFYAAPDGFIFAEMEMETTQAGSLVNYVRLRPLIHYRLDSVTDSLTSVKSVTNHLYFTSSITIPNLPEGAPHSPSFTCLPLRTGSVSHTVGIVVCAWQVVTCFARHIPLYSHAPDYIIGLHHWITHEHIIMAHRSHGLSTYICTAFLDISLVCPLRLCTTRTSQYCTEPGFLIHSIYF